MKRKWINVTFGIIIFIIVLLFLIMHFVKTPHKYQRDIQRLKMENSEYYYKQFPDELPESATKIKWICVSSMMQGSGYDALFFYADKSYLSEVYNHYVSEADIYHYKDYAWVDSKDKAAFFPKINDMTDEEKSNVIVFIIYDNGDMNHPHNSGIYMNQEEGYICFFAQ